jgi:DNA (cytosine-5)-methyltransferase 1
METDEHRYKHLDIFSGIGGFSLAFEAEGFRTVAFVECDERKQIVLRYWWKGVPIFADVRDAESIRRFCAAGGGIDVLTGGVPCQPASTLGQMRGSADERWMWPDAIRLVRAIRPRFAVFENPPSVLVLEGGRAWNGIVSGLAALRYDLWWDVFPAAAFGAGHLRERVILVAADTHGPGLEGHAGNEFGAGGGRKRDDQLPRRIFREISANPNCERRKSEGNNEQQVHPAAEGNREITQPFDGDSVPDLRGRVFATETGEPQWWSETHTGIPVLAHGLSARLVEAAARCTGDAVVPQVIRPIARAIRQMLERNQESADDAD